jgi:type I restriction enzyme S subunit
MSFNKWENISIGDICQTISETHKRKKGELIFLNTGDIERGKILHNKYSPVEKMPGQAKKSIKKGDILFSEIRPANGRWAYVDFEADDFILSTKLMAIRANEKVNSRYLYHLLTSPEIVKLLQLLAETRSGTFPQITFTQVADIEIKLPPMPIQNKISSFFDALDRKIELNRLTNQTLEKIAHTFFREMCLPNTAELLQGWQEKKLGDFITLKNGFAFKGNDFVDFGVPVIKIKNIKSGKVILNNLSYVSREIANKNQKFKLNKYDLLITMSGNRIDGTPETWVGKVGIFHKEGEYLLNQRNAVIGFSTEISKYFMLQLLCSEEMQYYFIANATSSGGQANISPTLINNTEVIIPPINVIEKYDSLVNSVYENIFSNELETEALTELRDNLLPKIMKGEIEINNL